MRVTAKVLVCGVSQREGKDKDGRATGRTFHNATLYGIGEDASSHEFSVPDVKLVAVLQGMSGKMADVVINLREFKGIKNFDVVAVKAAQ